jgi:hypothetical protein
MPKFQVEIKTITYGFVNIKARNKEEAKKKVKKERLKPLSKNTFVSILDEVTSIEEVGS